MFCGATCILAGSFIFSSFYMMINGNKSCLKGEFASLLNQKKLKIYKSVIAERFKIYSEGFILGFLKMIVILALLKNTRFFKRTNIACLAVVILFVTNYFYYMLHKKSTYMVQHITTKKQMDAWLKIYKTMQFNNYFGFLLGLVGMVLFTLSFCK